jgi:hypothetical protein
VSIESNIVNLNEWRYRAIVPAKPPRRKRWLVTRAAGGILVVASLGFGPYVTYSAAQLGALTDAFVLGTLGVLSVYLLAGAVLLTGVYRRLLPGKSPPVSAAVRSTRQEAGAAQAGGAVVKRPEPAELAEPRPLWVRCRFCRAPFQAAGARDECPGCGKMAAA